MGGMNPPPWRVLLLGCVLLIAAAPRAQGRVDTEASADSTTKLFNEPYRPSESRHYEVSSSTFAADAAKQFDLSYADGTVLRGFNGKDVVQVRYFPRVQAGAWPGMALARSLVAQVVAAGVAAARGWSACASSCSARALS